MKLRTAILIGSAIVLVPVAVAAGLVFSIDPNAYRGAIADKLRQSTGRDVTLAGPLRVGLSLTPTLVASDVTLGNIPGASRPVMATMQQLEVKIDLLSLLRGDIEIGRLILVGADVSLERLADGRANWLLNPARAAQSPSAAAPADTARAQSGTLPVLEEVRLVDSRVAYADRRNGRTHQLTVTVLETSLLGPDAKLPLTVRGSFDGQPLDLSGTLASPRPLMEGEGLVSGSLKGTALGLTLDIEGKFGLGTQSGRAEGRAGVSGSSLAGVEALVGRKFPKVPAFSLISDLTLNDAAIDIRDFKLVLGSGEATAKGRLNRQGGQSSLAVSGKFPKPEELSDLLPAGVSPDQPLSVSATVTGTLQQMESRDFSISYGPGAVRGPISLDLSGPEIRFTSDVVATLTDAGLLTGVLKLKKPVVGPVTLVGKFSGTPSVVTVSGLDLKLMDSSLKGNLTADTSGKSARLTGDFALSLADPSALAGLWGIEVPVRQPAALSGRLAATNAGFALQQMDFRLGQAQLGGQLALATGGVRPKLTGSLQTAALDLDALSGGAGPGSAAGQQAGTGGAASGKAGGRVFSPDPFDLSLLGALDANLTLQASKLIVGGQSLTPLTLTAVLENGAFAVGPLRAGYAGGQISGEVQYGTKGALSVALSGTGLETKALLIAMGQQPVLDTAVNLNVSLNANGVSAAALAGSLSGRTEMATTRVGVFNHRYITPLSGDLAKLIIPDHAGADQLLCFVSRTDWRGGIGTIGVLGMDTKILAISGSGRIDLGREALAMRLTPRKREQSLTSLAPPVDIGGTFQNPSFTPDLGALAGQVLQGEVGQVLQQELGKAGNPLGQILGGVLQQRSSTSARPAAFPTACAG